MKFFLGLGIFVFALVVSLQSLANEGAERDNTALFPPKKADKSLTTRPDKAELLEPTAMSQISGSTVTLRWKEGAGATSFHVQVATDPNFKWLKEDQNLFKQTSLEVKELEPGKHYYWRVASVRVSNNASYIKSDFSKSMFETTAK